MHRRRLRIYVNGSAGADAGFVRVTAGARFQRQFLTRDLAFGLGIHGILVNCVWSL